MTDQELSLREASKLLQFAPQTVKKMIKSGEIRATYTGKGKMRRYSIRAKDLPKANGTAKVPPAVVKRGRPHTNKATAKGSAQTFVSKAFTPDKDLSSAEQMLRTSFLNWCVEKLLAA